MKREGEMGRDGERLGGVKRNEEQWQAMGIMGDKTSIDRYVVGLPEGSAGSSHSGSPNRIRPWFRSLDGGPREHYYVSNAFCRIETPLISAYN